MNANYIAKKNKFKKHKINLCNKIAAINALKFSCKKLI